MVQRLLVLALLGGAMVTARAETLKGAFAGTFRIGAALNQAQFTGGSPVEAALAAEQFDSVTPENVLKWQPVHPKPGVWRLEPADRYVEFGTQHGMWIVGHTLVWHIQTPDWVFEQSPGKPCDRATLLERMREHIHTVVGRYRGRIRGWDVVNEVVDEDGTLRKSPWLNIIGEDYISKAFEYAHEADPAAELYYNDYSLEKPAKRQGALRLLTRLKAQGVPVKAIGLQGHLRLEWPPIAAEAATIEAFAALGLRVNVTELDIDVLPRPPRQPGGAHERMPLPEGRARAELDPYTGGLPDAVQRQLAERYRELFACYVAHHAAMDRVTFWDVTDASSWLNHWPVEGRTNHPLLFDRAGHEKPAFDAVIGTAHPR